MTTDGVSVYRLYNPQARAGAAHFFTTSAAEADALRKQGWKKERLTWYASAQGVLRSSPLRRIDVYRAYNPYSGEHLYTRSSKELSVLVNTHGWYDEGIAWRAISYSDVPVYRLFNPRSAEHHYTTNVAEKDALVAHHAWKYEGIAWYSSPGNEHPVYRQYNPRVRIGQHHYTVDKNEYTINNARHGWQAEGIAWYAIAQGVRKAHPIKPIDGIKDADARAMTIKAQGYSSATNWMILVNSTTARVGVYERVKGQWFLRHYWLAGPGADRSPTVKGQFTVGNRGYSFGKGYTAYYWTQFYGDYLFHSILYNQGTFNVQDGRLGQRVSHGCVRLDIANAKWIFDNIPRGTKVVSY